MSKLLCFVVVVALAAVSSSLRAQDEDDIVSHAQGFEALKKLVGNQDFRTDIEISPEQLGKLKQLLNSEKVKKAPRGFARFGIVFPDNLSEDNVSEDKDFGSFTSFTSSEENVDSIVATEIAKILHPSQIEAIRVRFLQKKLPFPSHALHSDRLAQIGLQRSEIDALLPRVRVLAKKIQKDCYDARRRSVATLLSSFPDESKTQFVKAFGTAYVPSSLVRGTFDASSIGIFKEDRGLSPLYQFPNARSEMRRIARRLRKESGFQNVDQREAVKEAVSELISPAQYNATFETMHLRRLEYDLRCILEPNVLRFLEIPNNLVAEIRKECDRLQGEIDELQMKLEVPMFKTLVLDSPKDTQDRLKQFYNGVWCELEE